MNLNCKFAVVIAAGGTGSRFGGDVPKQFVELLGFPVIAHTIKRFENCDLISEIVIVTHRDYVVYCNDLSNELGFKKITTVIEGGKSRQESVFKGIKQLSDDVTHVLVHDAARPNISEKIIEDVCENVREYEACAVGVRVVDTIKISEDGEFITATADRSKLWQIQTPQAFKKNIILKCHKSAAFEGFEATDDCMLAEKYGFKIKLIEGSLANIKITDSSDLAVMEGIIKCE